MSALARNATSPKPMSRKRERQAPAWLCDHDDGSWLDERGGRDDDDDDEKDYRPSPTRRSDESIPKQPRTSAPRPKPKPKPAAPPSISATATVTTKEERSLLAKYDELRAAIEASRRVTTKVSQATTTTSEPDRVKAAVAALARSNSNAFDPEEGQSGQLKRPSMKRRPGAREADGGAPMQQDAAVPHHGGWPDERDASVPDQEDAGASEGGMLSMANFARARAEDTAGDSDHPYAGAPMGFPSSAFPPSKPEAEEDAPDYADGGFDAMWS